jgi:DNA invertase Pin-like site-specific DNA recombinase
MNAMGQLVGYRRVSTLEQNSARQLEGIRLDEVFEDRASGKDTNRPQLEAMLKYVRKGDTVVVHSMDRLARHLYDLRRVIKDWTERGVQVRFVKENLSIDAGRRRRAATRGPNLKPAHRT